MSERVHFARAESFFVWSGLHFRELPLALGFAPMAIALKSRATGNDPAIPRPAQILIVDDDSATANLVKEWLQTDGYICQVAFDGNEALEKLKNHPFDLLITDIAMPTMTGMELLSHAKELSPHIAILIITGMEDRSLAIEILKGGAFGYITKPLDQNELLINITSALERRRLARESQRRASELERDVNLRIEQIRSREEEIALRLVAAAEYRDNETGAHIRRIGLSSAVLAEACGWSPNKVDEIRLAATMHDIGKIGIPDHILLKPGKLTPEEFEVMKTHTTIGAAILGRSEIPVLQMARLIALSHHERWDGTGYPQGLAGDEIPEAARIVSIVDVYDALVHQRVYKPAVPEREAIAIMKAARGHHFDPNMFDIFMQVLPNFRQIREQVADETHESIRHQEVELALSVACSEDFSEMLDVSSS